MLSLLQLLSKAPAPYAATAASRTAGLQGVLLLLQPPLRRRAYCLEPLPLRILCNKLQGLPRLIRKPLPWIV